MLCGERSGGAEDEVDKLDLFRRNEDRLRLFAHGNGEIDALGGSFERGAQPRPQGGPREASGREQVVAKELQAQLTAEMERREDDEGKKKVAGRGR
jgi:hypothetical protein